MKTQDKQIAEMLHAFDRGTVLRVIKLFEEDIDNEAQQIFDELREEGWRPVKEKPEDREFYVFGDDFWAQTDVALEISRKKALKQAKEQAKQQPPKETMELSITDLSCPKCKAKMHKQGICAGCKEGKQGYKLRLICEENPDHEILL